MVALVATSIVIVALLWEVSLPWVERRREAEMVRAFEDIPRTTDRVIFFPRAAGGAR